MKPWTRQSDTLLLAHAMSLAEVAELLGRTPDECRARAVKLGCELPDQVEPVLPSDAIVLTLRPGLRAVLAEAAAEAGESLEQFCAKRVREGWASYVPDGRLPALEGAAELLTIVETTRQRHGAGSMEFAAAEIVARRVLVHLLRGSIEQARLALDDGWEGHSKQSAPLPIGAALLDEPLARVIDDVRLLNTLEREGILTVGHFLDTGPDNWFSIAGIATKQVNVLCLLRGQLLRRSKEVA